MDTQISGARRRRPYQDVLDFAYYSGWREAGDSRAAVERVRYRHLAGVDETLALRADVARSRSAPSSLGDTSAP